MELFREKDIVHVCAPMVRYSKQAFRHLVRKYNCDLAYTPMIISESFVKSKEARDMDFTTNSEDRPLIVQFAANNGKDLADAAELVKPYSDGVGLNCGCPQRWAMTQGYGSHLCKHPELIKDMVAQVRQRVGNDFPCEIKIRIHKDIKHTVSLCQQAEHAGVSWISVHGRTITQRKEPVNYDAIKIIKDSLSIPVVANGDIKNKTDILKVKELTGVDGVMCAQGLLNNPTLFAGYDTVPKQCVKDWLQLSLSLGTPYSTYHHHLIYMMEKWFTKGERLLFNNLASTTAILDFLDEHFDIKYEALPVKIL